MIISNKSSIARTIRSGPLQRIIRHSFDGARYSWWWCRSCSCKRWSWPMAPKRTIRISAFELWSTIVCVQHTLIIIVTLSSRRIQCVSRSTTLQANTNVRTNGVITTLSLQAFMVVYLTLIDICGFLLWGHIRIF